MPPFSVFSPAKLNLFLAVTGRREDGFHELVSVVAPLALGDTLTIEGWEPGARGGGEPDFSLACDAPGVPTDESNLVLRAARAFQLASGWTGGAHFRLEKRIPAGAGLGGGSSNAVAALRALNRLAGEALGAHRLAEVAAQLGSDCPLFLHAGPVVMRGRGERVEPLPAEVAARLTGRRVLVFKPEVGISTAWAYARMAAEVPLHYLPVAAAEGRLAAWRERGAPAEELLFNNLEGVAFRKFIVLPVLQEVLRNEFGLVARMSGSGSACFALLPAGLPVGPVAATLAEFLGPGAFVRDTVLG